MSEYTEEQKQVYIKIQKILLEEWDPIGIGLYPEAKNEYDSYIPLLIGLLLMKKPKSEIFDYLCWIETGHMELTGNKERAENAIDKLVKITHDY